jgi:anti-sigma factor RsiW
MPEGVATVSTQHDHSLCKQLLSQFSDYIDGELDDAVCAELEAHLADCPDCRILVDTLRKTVSLYHDQPQPELPADVQRRLFKVLRLE